MGFKFNRRILNGETTNPPLESTTLSSLDQAVKDAVEAVEDAVLFGTADGVEYHFYDSSTLSMDYGYDPIKACGEFEDYMQELDCNLASMDEFQNYGTSDFDTDEEFIDYFTEWFDHYTDYYDHCSEITDFSIPDCKSFTLSSSFSLSSASNAVFNPFLIILLLLAFIFRH